jgi:hypothetical protein
MRLLLLLWMQTSSWTTQRRRQMRLLLQTSSWTTQRRRQMRLLLQLSHHLLLLMQLLRLRPLQQMEKPLRRLLR